MNTALKKALIRCDGAPEIGFGHVVRCLALADELRDSHGCEVNFAMLQGPQGIAQVHAQGYAVYQPAAGAEALDEGNWLQELITNNQHQVLILDIRTDLANAAVQSIRASGVLIVTIDDLSERRLLADLAFYPPIPQLEYLDWTGFTGQRFVGWDWVLLRPQFAKAARRARARWAKSTGCSTQTDYRKLTILVTMGGSDPAGLTLMALDAIEQLNGDFRVMVVIGNGFMHQPALDDRLAGAQQTYEILHDVTDIASIMTEADLAIASFGVTAYELAAVRVPSIYLCLTDDHSKSASLFTDSGFGLNLGVYTGISPSQLAQVLLASIVSARQNKKKEAPSPDLDGLGLWRIGRLILLTSEASE